MRDFGKDFFWVRAFSKNFLGVELDFFWVTFWTVGLFFGPGSSLKDFFWV